MVLCPAALHHQLSTPLKIGSVEVNSRVLQSPLSGVTDKVFRRLVRRYAPASMMYTEMVHAAGVCHVDTLPQIMEVDPDEHPISIQLFDCRPDFLADAARRAVDEGADTIDINMGCPVNKITRKGGGSSLLKDPETAVQLVQTLVEAVDVPVSVKTRIGWDDGHINAVEFARCMEDAGAQMLTLHGRTRAQGYTGQARWDWIGRVKAALSIPVIANGDIDSVDAAVRCLEQTQADGVMCSRGTLGYPFLVGEIDHYLKTGDRLPSPTMIDRLLCAQEHLRLIADYKGYRGICQARKHMTWYVKGFAGAADLRDALCRIESVSEGEQLLEDAIARLKDEGHATRYGHRLQSEYARKAPIATL
ncbi:tRNA dihydrouridine synthase DusB [Oscillatoria sp. CS-180]|uniref:tRNA dihydrouridine synthase DusB n=1 Tax=Oscillatoria sp. CS-180 TaxID=3021720 RepID=UPI00232EFDCC|nr:tRNA dihydrouridine synthase DusB [Oscillatoria sp. CS-180]MDB9524477.1 tRNA dihydrouridine synthase DusB [Oscillatoria sp. CS-180]